MGKETTITKVDLDKVLSQYPESNENLLKDLIECRDCKVYVWKFDKTKTSDRTRCYECFKEKKRQRQKKLTEKKYGVKIKYQNKLHCEYGESGVYIWKMYFDNLPPNRNIPFEILREAGYGLSSNVHLVSPGQFFTRVPYVSSKHKAGKKFSYLYIIKQGWGYDV